jgi:hypothetical protein
MIVVTQRPATMAWPLDEPTTTGQYTGSITPFGVGQKVNIIVTLVEIMVTFCELQNVIRV